MQDGQIVAMIDACLERLQAARRLLSNVYDSSVIEAMLSPAEARTTKTKKKVRPAIGIKKNRKDELTASLFEQTQVLVAAPPVPSPAPQGTEPKPHSQPVVVAVRPEPTIQIVATPARRESAPRPKKIAFPVGALANHAPAGPVVVSASQVSKESAEKRAVVEAKRTPPSQSSSAPLTAEMLAKRWLQGAQA